MANPDYEIGVENDGCGCDGCTDGLEAGKLANLNDLVPGAKVTFVGWADGIVVGDMGTYTTKGGTDDIVERRLHIKHGNVGESFHTYRHDGRSTSDASHDITSVTVKTPREKLYDRFVEIHSASEGKTDLFNRLYAAGLLEVES